MNGIFGIGIAELFFIAIIALVVLGPERLPGVMREGAKYFRMARNLSSELTSQFSEELKALDDINPQKIIREVLDDPTLDEINPKSIMKDLSGGQGKGKKPDAKKSTAKKPAAKKPAASTASSRPEGAAEPASESASVVAASAASQPLAEKAVDTDVEASAADEDTAVAASTASDEQSQPETPEDVKAPEASEAPESPPTTEEAVVAPPPENRIAPDELATNLEHDDADSPEAADTTAVPAEPASLSVNGTHDSVEDRA